jgi:lipopolysaccharide export LptBFGC system permease protein LptF
MYTNSLLIVLRCNTTAAAAADAADERKKTLQALRDKRPGELDLNAKAHVKLLTLCDFSRSCPHFSYSRSFSLDKSSDAAMSDAEWRAKETAKLASLEADREKAEAAIRAEAERARYVIVFIVSSVPFCRLFTRQAERARYFTVLCILVLCVIVFV